MRRVLAAVRTGGRWVLRQMGRIVNDSPASTRPPGSNYMPNSNGEGGRVISSGDSGANSQRSAACEYVSHRPACDRMAT